MQVPGGRLRRNLFVASALRGVAIATALFGTCVYADLVVPSGGSYALNGGSTDLGCTDLIVGGALSVDSGSIRGIRNVTIQSGGSVTVTSGSISLSGDWSNAGSFGAGSGSVSFVDLAGCAPTGGTISGNTSFASLSFITATGKTYRIASGSAQTVTQNLVIQGAPGLPLVLRGSTAGQPASLNLTGTQSISNFGAADLVAGANWIAPNQVNAISGGVTPRIFGDPFAPIPVLPANGLALLVLLLSALAVTRMRAGKRLELSNK